jgi:senataxin
VDEVYNEADSLSFNTVDGFQGQEKDIIILSCVRSGPNLRSIGFLKDFRRMNVALTRAKSSLFVIGNAATLERSDTQWRDIVKDARDRGFLLNVRFNVKAKLTPTVQQGYLPSKAERARKGTSDSPPVARGAQQHHPKSVISSPSGCLLEQAQHVACVGCVSAVREEGEGRSTAI